eukprot:15364857-Ditylum_brightwellii.AAC.6
MGGNKEIFSKEEVTSSTVSTEAVLLTSIIDAKKGQGEAKTDIPVTYLNTDMDNEVIMLMVKLAPELALLFYNKLVGYLQDIRFEDNPYDPCVANKKIKGKEMIICWHIDDLKISHEDSREARQDIQTSVAFLTTGVKEPDKDDWKKLKQVILYLNRNLNLVTTLSANKLNVAKWWVDGSYATHPNMQGHAGDEIESREVEVKHCGVQDMIADYFIKPLQGHLFRKFCKAVLNLEDE